MSQIKNVDGYRYFKGVCSVTRKKALLLAKQKRKRGFHARALPDSDHRGYYAVYTRMERKKRKRK